jgi:hypothetical protein
MLWESGGGIHKSRSDSEVGNLAFYGRGRDNRTFEGEGRKGHRV